MAKLSPSILAVPSSVPIFRSHCLVFIILRLLRFQIDALFHSLNYRPAVYRWNRHTNCTGCVCRDSSQELSAISTKRPESSSQAFFVRPNFFLSHNTWPFIHWKQLSVWESSVSHMRLSGCWGHISCTWLKLFSVRVILWLQQYPLPHRVQREGAMSLKALESSIKANGQKTGAVTGTVEKLLHYQAPLQSYMA